MRTSRLIVYSSILFTAAAFSADNAVASPSPEAAAQQSATKGRRSKGSAKNQGKAPAGQTRKNASGKKGTSSRKETSSDVRRRQEATLREIKLTEEQIRDNERSVKKGLNELGKLDTDMAASREKIKATTRQISALDGQIGTLESEIGKNRSELDRLRAEYLKAVRKMRVARKNNSQLAFVFASKDFHQALRRMRYLRQFSRWKDRQSEAISTRTRALEDQGRQLSAVKARHDEALKVQKKEELALREQHARQDAIVGQLREKGDALRSHLAKKQSEANSLRNRISALIAEEQRRAAEEQARREEQERKERERVEKERREREEAERARQEAELLAQASKEEKAGDVKTTEVAKPAKVKADDGKAKETKKKEDKKAKEKGKEKERTKKKTVVREKSVPKGNGGGEYADARRRRPRSEGDNMKKGAMPASAGNGFSGMRGSLPRPVSGAFKVTSRFGRQSLPELPDVVYDNPGIDAEVVAGASALAVYGGKVSGVYMLPGYNTVVIVNHGNYYTVYGNISSPAVKVGDTVRAGQGLGSLAPDEEDRSRSSIHFEVWKNREKLNPLDWIR